MFLDFFYKKLRFYLRKFPKIPWKTIKKDPLGVNSVDFHDLFVVRRA